MEDSNEELIAEKFPALAIAIANLVQEAVRQLPTTPENMQKTCSLYQEHLNPNGLIINGLDPNDEYYEICCSYAFTVKALEQRGIMNLAYYLIVDELLASVNSSNDFTSHLQVEELYGQEGGMNLKKIFTTACVAFMLLGSTQSLDDNYQNARNDRKRNADADFEIMTSEQTYILPKDKIIIAKKVSKENIRLINEKIGKINKSLRESTQIMTTQCSTIANGAKIAGLFSNTDLITNVERQTDQRVSRESQPSTSGLAQDSTAYFVNGIGRLGNALGKGLQGEKEERISPNREKIAQEIYSREMQTENNLHAALLEEASLQSRYLQMCGKGIPAPTYFVATTTNEKPNTFTANFTPDTYDVMLSSSYGNIETGKLLKINLDTIAKINIKTRTMSQMIERPADYDEIYQRLISLKEKIEVLNEAILKSQLFIPLEMTMEGDGEGYDALANIARATFSTNEYSQLAQDLSLELPISTRNAETISRIRGEQQNILDKEQDQSTNIWNGNIERYLELVKTALAEANQGIKIVGDAAVEGADIVTDVPVNLVKKAATKVGDVAEHGAKETNRAFDAWFKTIYSFLYQASPMIGIVAAILVLFLTFKLSFRRDLLKMLNPFRNGSAPVSRQESIPPINTNEEIPIPHAEIPIAHATVVSQNYQNEFRSAQDTSGQRIANQEKRNKYINSSQFTNHINSSQFTNRYGGKKTKNRSKKSKKIKSKRFKKSRKSKPRSRKYTRI